MKHVKKLLLIACLYQVGIMQTVVESYVDDAQQVKKLSQQDVNFFNANKKNQAVRDRLIENDRNVDVKDSMKRAGVLSHFNKAVATAHQAKNIENYQDGDKVDVRQRHASFWGHFVLGEGGSFASRWDQYQAASKAESLIKEQQKKIMIKEPKFMSENFIQNLKPYEIEALQPKQIALISDTRINALDVGKLNHRQINALTREQIAVLTPQNIGKVDNRLSDQQIGYLKPEQIAILSPLTLDRLDNDTLVTLAEKFKDSPIPQNISNTFNEKFREYYLSRKTSVSFKPEWVKYLTLNKDSIFDLEHSEKLLNYVTPAQVDQFLNTQGYKGVRLELKEATLQLLAKAFKNRTVPESLRVELDKLREAKAKAGAEAKAREKAEAQAEARAKARAEAGARAQAEAEARAEEESKARAKAEADKTEPQGRAGYRGQEQLKKYFTKEDYEKLNTALISLDFNGNALDQQAWKKFYRTQALLFHPDKPTADEDKMRLLNLANDYLNAYYL